MRRLGNGGAATLRTKVLYAGEFDIECICVSIRTGLKIRLLNYEYPFLLIITPECAVS